MKMACFIVPMVLAILVTVLQGTARNLSEKLKLSLLNALLWGGVILLAIEHIWHGEITPWPPFLTAMATPADIPIMLHEMATVGTAMSAAVVLTWATTLTITRLMLKTTELKGMEQLKKPLAPAQPL
jgi:hypothetical protein